ncbi:MAG TPA: thioredoxin family protein [Chloroflexota bacterium]|nr:thioredoxin family protein [Chloroflexota bacterium]
MIERLIFTLLLIAAVTAVYYLLKRQHLRQMGAIQTSGLPTILYFGSASCAVCPAQARYLEQVEGEWHGRVAIQKIDAELEPEKASQYRVFTLPTTILVDAFGQVREINYGLTNSHKLSKQVASLQVAGSKYLQPATCNLPPNME